MGDDKRDNPNPQMYVIYFNQIIQPIAMSNFVVILLFKPFLTVMTIVNRSPFLSHLPKHYLVFYQMLFLGLQKTTTASFFQLNILHITTLK